VERFWRIFKDVAYFRISWRIQDIFIDAFKTYEKEKEKQSIENNIDEIKDKVYNNKFNAHRKKK
tara:strand:- start:305 stop:496 length:192 start_codon:yes stop_codon:yes gene_type:complete